MKTKTRTTQKMARRAFGLLLEMRQRENASQLLTQAIAYLEVLAQEKVEGATPVMLSIRVIQLGKT